MQSLVPRLRSSPVLLVGKGDVEYVAKLYGFEKIATTEQLARVYPAAAPFWKEKLNDRKPNLE